MPLSLLCSVTLRPVGYPSLAIPRGQRTHETCNEERLGFGMVNKPSASHHQHTNEEAPGSVHYKRAPGKW